MKKLEVSEAYWMTRFGPYLLAAVLITFGLSLLKAVPLVWCVLLGGVSGGLVFFFHALKWQTGMGRFQFAAMASWLFPFFGAIKLSHGSGIWPGFQYVAIFATVYFLGITIFRRQIRAWTQS